MAEIEPYRTSDTPFAAYLHYCGHKLIGSIQDPNDHKREVMLFIKDDIIPEMEKTWRQGKANGELREYHRSLKIVTRQINENRKSRD